MWMMHGEVSVRTDHTDPADLAYFQYIRGDIYRFFPTPPFARNGCLGPRPEGLAPIGWACIVQFEFCSVGTIKFWVSVARRYNITVNRNHLLSVPSNFPNTAI